jgi:hypothetical protein
VAEFPAKLIGLTDQGDAVLELANGERKERLQIFREMYAPEAD